MSTSVIELITRTASSSRRQRPRADFSRPQQTEADLRVLLGEVLDCSPEETATIMIVLARAVRWTEHECRLTPLQAELAGRSITRLLSSRTRDERLLQLQAALNAYHSYIQERQVDLKATTEGGVIIVRS